MCESVSTFHSSMARWRIPLTIRNQLNTLWDLLTQPEHRLIHTNTNRTNTAHYSSKLECIHNTHMQYTHAHVHTCTYIHAHTHTHIHTRTYTHTHMHIHTCTCTYMHIHTCTYTHAHTHMHTYTHACKVASLYLEVVVNVRRIECSERCVPLLWQTVGGRL